MALEDIEAKQKAITEDAKKMAKLTDPQEILDAAAKIVVKAKELERAALNLAAAATPPGPRNEGGEVRVVLTPDQRKRIVEQTGVGLEVLTVDRGAAALHARMPTMQKQLIERLALQEAAVHVVIRERRKAIAKLIKQLEAIEDKTPDMEEIIEQLKRDPDKIKEKALEIAERIKARPLPTGLPDDPSTR